MSKQSNLTIKGQVTIPKDVRDALGLKPGEPVEFGWNAAGEAVIRKPAAAAPEAAREKRLQRIRETATRFAHLRLEGDAVEIVRELRGGEDSALL